MYPQFPLPLVCFSRRALLALCLILLIVPYCQADDQDTSLRLNQSIDLNASQQERQILQEEDYLQGERPELTVNGKTYTIRHHVSDVGRALYVSIQQKQWPAVVHFLEEYLTFDDADPMLVAYARGTLARQRGNMEEAEAQFRKLLEIRPDFVLGQLELARVLFESRQDAESATAFQQIARTLDPADARQQGVLTTVDSFLKAVDRRQSWQGSLSLGPIWSDNLNNTSESYTCIAYFQSICWFKRETPQAISGRGLDYEFTLNRRFAVSGHHGLFTRSLIYGQSYKDHATYNESELSTRFGYSYHDRRNQLSLAPSFQLSRYGNDSVYDAWGLHGEWQRYLSARVMVKLQADYQDQNYRQDRLADQYDGEVWSAYATAWYAFPGDWTLFGGLDWSEKAAEVDQNAYHQVGARLGLAKTFNRYLNAVVFSSVRKREHDAYSPLLEETRQDTIQNYSLILRSPALALYGFEPSLTLKHRHVKSNVDWLYSYERNSVSLKFEKRF